MTSDLSVPADLLIHSVEGGQLVVQDVGGHLSDVGLVQVPAHALHLLQQPGLLRYKQRSLKVTDPLSAHLNPDDPIKDTNV